MSDSLRKVAAVIAADVVGFSTLMESNEPRTVELLEERRQLFNEIVAQYGGREFGSVGDSLMAELPDAENAVICAIQIQKDFTELNAALSEDEQMLLRIGINLGDLIERDGLLYGDEVNIAARLQALAPSGGILVSSSVYQKVSTKLDIEFEHLGSKKVKNISTPISIYHVVGIGEAIPSKHLQWFSRGVMGLLLASLTLLLINQLNKTNDNEAALIPTLPKYVNPKSIAVLPFRNRSSANQEADYLAFGIHEELLTRLTNIQELEVISRTSVMRFKNSDESIPSISSQLSVANVVEGSLIKVGDEIRINVQLIDAENDRNIWARTFSTRLDVIDIFDLQSNIAEEIAESLNAELKPEEKELLSQAPTSNFDAYKSYLLGKQAFAERTQKSIETSISFFENAYQLDPKFALAYVGKADALAMQTYYSGSLRSEAYGEAEDLVIKALDTAYQSVEAYTSLANLQHSRFDYVSAEQSYKHALQLNKNYATAYQWYGSLLVDLGRADEALQQFNNALKLDPLSIIINTNVAQALGMKGSIDEALAQTNRILEIDASSPHGYWIRGQLYWTGTDKLEDAYSAYVKSISLSESPNPIAFFGLLNLDLGLFQEAQCFIDKSMSLSPESFYTNYALQFLRLHQGSGDLAFSASSRALKAHPVWWRPLSPILASDSPDLNDALKWYTQRYPALMESSNPTIDRTNFGVALDLAFVLQKLGMMSQAQVLILRVETQLEKLPRLGLFGYFVDDARIQVLNGNHDEAMQRLIQARAEGWRHTWRYHLYNDPILKTLHHRDDYQRLREELEFEMIKKRAQIQESEMTSLACMKEAA
ncbi:MAG: hypothetical protein JJ957_08420 [Pseudomonadales bacterium]|nr:hypothetical protein [Pseudomonadales bacterium]MBO6596484.1 hypothetical protein [Pseudomonadales bacterium]MBO6822964.1 hypothetical protein [Pseudomonadales bacterium]